MLVSEGCYPTALILYISNVEYTVAPFFLITSMFIMYVFLRVLLQYQLGRVDNVYACRAMVTTFNNLIGGTLLSCLMYAVTDWAFVVYAMLVCVPIAALVLADLVVMSIKTFYWLYEDLCPESCPIRLSSSQGYQTTDLLFDCLYLYQRLINLVVQLWVWLLQSKAVVWVMQAVRVYLVWVRWFLSVYPVKWLVNVFTVILTVGRYLLSRLEYLASMLFTFALTLYDLVTMPWEKVACITVPFMLILMLLTVVMIYHRGPSLNSRDNPVLTAMAIKAQMDLTLSFLYSMLLGVVLAGLVACLYGVFGVYLSRVLLVGSGFGIVCMTLSFLHATLSCVADTLPSSLGFPSSNYVEPLLINNVCHSAVLNVGYSEAYEASLVSSLLFTWSQFEAFSFIDPTQYSLGLAGVGFMSTGSIDSLPHNAGWSVVDVPDTVSVPVDYMPWHVTDHLIEGFRVLARMYDNSDGPLRQFLTLHCLHMLSPPTGASPLPKTLANPAVLALVPYSTPLTRNYSATFVGSLNINNGAGAYAFFRPNSVDQCGSCINFASRLYNHYFVDSRNDRDKPFYRDALVSDLGLGIYQFVPFYRQPDWVALYEVYNPGHTPEQIYIVRAFLQQAIRTIEQTYSSNVQPTYYNDLTSRVKVWHLNWVPGTVLVSREGNTVLWILPDGIQGMSPSVKAASARFGISYSTIKAHASQGEYSYTNTPNEGKVGFLFKHLPVVEPRKKTSNTLVDHSKLEEGLVYVFDSQMNQMNLPGAPYAKLGEAAVAIGLPFKATLNPMVNILQPVNAPALGDNTHVYLARRDKLTDYPVTLTSLTAEGALVTHSFENMTKAKVALGSVKIRGSAVSLILNECTINGWVVRFKQQDTCLHFLKEASPSATAEQLADLSLKLSTVPPVSTLTEVGKPFVFDEKLKAAHSRQGVVATHITTGVSVAYDSILLAARTLSPNGEFSPRNTLVRRHITKGEPYHDYLFRYWDPSKDVGIPMMREDRSKRDQYKVNIDQHILED